MLASLEQNLKQANLKLGQAKLALAEASTNRPQISDTSVELVQEGIPYRYTIDITSEYPRHAILRRKNMITKDEGVIEQDIRGCAYHSKRIEKIATDGKDVYVSFDDSNARTQIGKVVQEDEWYGIWFIGLYQHTGLEKTIKDLALESGRVYVAGFYEYLNIPGLFGLGGLEVKARSESCGPH